MYLKYIKLWRIPTALSDILQSICLELLFYKFVLIEVLENNEEDLPKFQLKGY